MGSITSGIGLISGIDTASLINQLIAIQSRPKMLLQQRIASIGQQRTAMLDINARLLNIKNSATAFRTDSVFGSTTATSSDESILTAKTSRGAQTGIYKFIVKQRVTNAQLLTKGFASTTATPLGLNQLSFEFGAGRVSRDRNLADLNGGGGVNRGRIIITDQAGSSATIDLTDVTTLAEVLDRINSSNNIAVTAAVSGDSIKLTDTSGGGGTLTVTNFGSFTTATDLGLTSLARSGNQYTAATINTVGTQTALTSLNDGNGVLIVDNNPDFIITARDGTVFNIDLGRIDAPIDNNTLLEKLNNGRGITITNDAADLTIVATNGTQLQINLGQLKDSEGDVTEEAVTTVGQLLNRINTALANEFGSGKVVMSINSASNGFNIVDTVGGGGNLQVLGAGVNGAKSAQELGIYTGPSGSGSTVTGQTVRNTVKTPRASTIQDVLDRINNAFDDGSVANSGRIVATLGDDGTSIKITDTTGGGGNLVIAASVSNSLVAKELGIEANVAENVVSGDRIIAALQSVMVKHLNGGAGLGTGSTTLSGSTLLSSLLQGAGLSTNGNPASPDLRVQDRTGALYDIELDGLSTVQDLIDAVSTTTGGGVMLAINGQTLEVTNNTVGPEDFFIADLNGSTAATELGLAQTLGVLDGEIIAGINTDPAASTLLTITNRSGVTRTLDIGGFHSLSQILDHINSAVPGITASLNSNGTGLQITDSSGGVGNLIIAGDGATTLGIAANVADTSVTGSNLQQKYVSEGSLLSSLNYGRGVGTGSFRITDGLGQSATVNIDIDSVTVEDVIREINSRGIAVRARINDNGDGVIIEQDNAALGGQTPFVKIKVVSTSGTVANDLNLVGEATDVNGGFIDGSYERVIDLNPSDSLANIVAAINSSGVPVSASILNTASGAAPFRLSLASGISGKAGDLIIDTGGVDLGFTTLTAAQDAKVFFGADSPEHGFLVTSSTNTISGVLQGVTIDLKKASESVVELTIEPNNTAIVEAVNRFVTTINDAIGRINQYDFYDVDKNEKGVLLGDSTVARVRQSLYTALRTPARNVTTQYTLLSQVGIRVSSKGKIEFDQSKFEAALASDPQAVANLFSAFKQENVSTEQEIAPGVTVSNSSIDVITAGLGQIFDELMDKLTNSIDGTLKLVDTAYEDRIKVANNRIAQMDTRLAAERTRLERQFAAMEVALARLQQQTGALSGLQTLAANTRNRR